MLSPNCDLWQCSYNSIAFLWPCPQPYRVLEDRLEVGLVVTKSTTRAIEGVRWLDVFRHALEKRKERIRRKVPRYRLVLTEKLKLLYMDRNST